MDVMDVMDVWMYGCYIIITWTSFKSIYVTASKRILNANI